MRRKSDQSKIRKGFALAAVASVVITAAGILHLGIAFEVMATSTFAASIFFAFGIPQLGWVIPTIRQLGIKWYAAGIAWNGALIGFFLMTLVPNPVTGVAIPPVTTDIVIEILQGIFIGLSALMILQERKRKHLREEERADLI